MNPSSKIVLYENRNGKQIPLRNPMADMEDPFVSTIDGRLILGGVKVSKTSEGTSYKTVIYEGTSHRDLREFTEGPEGMKDIRLVQYSDRSSGKVKIGVFTRPQGAIGGLGQIGFTSIDRLEDLNPEVVAKAPLIAMRFPPGEWGGVNQADPLSDGRILALGHRAYYGDDSNKNYLSWLFIHDPVTGVSQDLGIIAASSDFEEVEQREPNLGNVIFSGGIKWKHGKSPELYVGIGDMEAGKFETSTLQEIFDYRGIPGPVPKVLSVL